MGVHQERPTAAYRPTGPPSSGRAPRATESASVGRTQGRGSVRFTRVSVRGG